MLKSTITSMALWLCMSVAALAQSSGPLDGKVFGSGNKALVVVLHGDVSKGGAADYHYKVAQKIASQNKGTTVLAMLRPGYYDSQKRKSAGSNNGRSDHYTAKNNQLVAATIQKMAKQVGTRKIVGLGHSGGAAQLGVIAGAYPNLLDSVILVSCPCDIPKWRSIRGKSAWRNSQSSQAFVGNISKRTRVIAITGTSDTNTRMVLAQSYVAAAKARGVPAIFVPANGASHGFNKMASLAAKYVRQEVNQ